MRTLRIAIFIAVALIQLSVPASVIWKREQTLKQGRVWKFRTAPVDPVDVIRGRYIALRFKAEEFPLSQPVPSSQPSPYLVLKADEEGFAVVDRVSETPQTGDDVLKVERVWFYDNKCGTRFPFDRFWVTEKNAVAAEQAYIENSRRGKENAHVTVRIRNGDAAIEQLYIDNQPLAEYLRAHPPK